MNVRLGVYSVWPAFAVLFLVLALAATPLLRTADAPNGTGPRLAAIDGLRGFLALGVFLHHAAINHRYMIDGQWTLPPSRFYTMAGQGGVAMFFMITGHLFWARLLRTDGRTDWLALYVGRLFRIAPLYLVATGTAACIVLYHTGMALLVPAGALAGQLEAWLALGWLPWPQLNLDPQSPHLLAGVTWTLHYEWLFYAALAPLGLLAQSGRLRLVAPAAGLFLCLLFARTPPTPLPAIFAALFLAGMTSASLRHAGVVRLPEPVGSAVALALVGAAFVLCPTSYGPPAVLLLGIAFHLIAEGADLFGLLTSRPACRLGAASYGIYLLQGLALALVFGVPALHTLALGSPAGHWAVTALCAIVLVLAAGLAHATIERPGIVLGRRAVAALRARRQQTVPAD